MKFEDAYKRYLDYVSLKQKKQSIKTLQTRFENRILPFFCNCNIYSLSDIAYLNWQKYILDNFNYSNNYKSGLHYIMCGFFDYCVTFLGVNCNIPKKVGNFKMRNVKVVHKFYSLNEFKHFIKYVDNNVYKQFFNLMFFTGTRPGEAMALRFSDLNRYSISITKTISEHSFNGERIIDDPKSISSFREIVIDKKLYNNLMKLKEYYDFKYKMFDYDYFIFGGIKPLAPTTINRYKLKACSDAHLDPIKLHEFRHSHASLLYSCNVSMQDIKERLGHSDINVTMGTYVHLVNHNRLIRILNFLRLFI